MNLDLESMLDSQAIDYRRLVKSDKVKLMAQWTRNFPTLCALLRNDASKSPQIAMDAAAESQMRQLKDPTFYILPDDRSGMSSLSCRANAVPDLRELVSDTITGCDDLVVVACDFSWSVLWVNHGSPELVAIYFSDGLAAHG